MMGGGVNLPEGNATCAHVALDAIYAGDRSALAVYRIDHTCLQGEQMFTSLTICAHMIEKRLPGIMVSRLTYNSFGAKWGSSALMFVLLAQSNKPSSSATMRCRREVLPQESSARVCCHFARGC